METRKINFALIGCGYWGSNFLRIIQNTDTVQLLKVCDADPARLSVLSTKHSNIHFTASADHVINDPDIDAVVVCTPVNNHFELTEKLLVAGKHVLCEKPLTNRAHECDHLYQLSQKQKVVLLVGHVFEYNSVVQHMKHLITNRDIGEIRYLQFTRMGLGPVRNDVSVIFDLAAHDVSIALSFMNQMPVAVSANGSSFLQKHIADVAFIQLEFPGGIYASISVSWLDPIKQRLVKVVGSKKMLLFDDVSVSEKLKIIEAGKNYQINSGDFGSFQLSTKDGEIIIPNLHHPEPLITEFNHFVNCISQNKPPLTDAANATRIVKVLEAAEASIYADGKKIML